MQNLDNLLNMIKKPKKITANRERLILNKIARYQPKKGLDHVARFFISMASVKHKKVIDHSERVALLSEVVAKKLKVDPEVAFFTGLFHGVGKIVLPHNLFDGHDINQDEYAEVKKHAVFGSEILKRDYPYIALCVGLHHAIYKNGYGLKMKDIPKTISRAKTKKVLQTTAIVSISDFIDAFTHRKTKIKDGSDKTCSDLKGMLYAKYPGYIQIIDTALEEFPNIKFWK